MLRAALASIFLGLLPALADPEATPHRPNILWLTSEDHGPQLGCYGDPLATTPNLDGLAARGLRFQRVWSCAPVCAPARTTLISGMYASSLGAEHMRSSVPLPDNTLLLPQLLREAGYYSSNNSKEDYNVIPRGRVWDESSGRAHWRQRPADRPFFAVFNSTASHEGVLRARSANNDVDPARIRLPAYHPDRPAVRTDWARYYAAVHAADAEAGARLRELEQDGLSETTIVFYFSDHGPGLPRCKRTPLDSGLHVPLLMYFPEQFRHLAPTGYQAGASSPRLISFADLAPTVLSLAGVRPPDGMQGVAFAGPFAQPSPRYLFGFRGRMDERYDLVRSVTDGRYVYVRNFQPHRPQGQHVSYEFGTATTALWYDLFKNKPDQLTAAQRRYWTTPREAEELYDLENDPDEVVNLAAAAALAGTVERMRAALREHAVNTADLGFIPEAEMHARCGQSPPRTMLGPGSGYPLEEVIDWAYRATSRKPLDGTVLARGLVNPEAAIRYWAVTHLLITGVIEEQHAHLLQLMADPSASVRVVAAETLCRWGSKTDGVDATSTLVALADPVKHGAYVAAASLNALDLLGIERTGQVWDRISSLPDHDPQAAPRAQLMVPRLREHVRQAAVPASRRQR